jgi:imidazolonepropionase-like amidohydrolase
MQLRHYPYLLIVSLFCIGVCWAQQAASAPKTVVIRAGRLLDVKTGRFLLQQEIVIEGDKIKAVRPYDLSPSGEQFIDLTNATVLPGLIDAHTHITMTTNFGYSRLAISVPREALNGARNARVTLDAGFTTIRNVGASGFTDVALRDAINAGDVPGPRMLVSGPALSITGGHCDNNLLPFESHVQSAGVGWYRSCPAQDARDHQVRCRPH